MKLLFTLSLPFLLIWMIGCASTQSTADSSDSSQSELQSEERPSDSISDDKDYYRNLSDYLERIPGVNFSGNSVTIRGISSFNSGIEPLFVIDGQAVGSSYAQANSMISPRDIDYVRVLKGADAAIYGVRGGNGVILIVTKK